MAEYGNYPKCVECNRYELLEQRCGVDKTPRDVLERQCETHRHTSVAPDIMQKKLYDLAMLIAQCVGGEYYSLVQICKARVGAAICPKGKDGRCQYEEDVEVTVVENGETITRVERKLVNCEFKDKYLEFKKQFENQGELDA